MEVTLLGIVTEVKLLHSRKAAYPIEVTLLGIVTEIKLLQPEKASYPIEVTLLGIVMDVKPLQPWYLQIIVYQFVSIKTVEK